MCRISISSGGGVTNFNTLLFYPGTLYHQIFKMKSGYLIVDLVQLNFKFPFHDKCRFCH